MARVSVLIETHDDVYDSLSRNETGHSGFSDPIRRVRRCVCVGSGCGQCERSAARAGELGIRLKPGFVLVEERDPYDTGVDGVFDPNARSRREQAKLIDDTIERLQVEQLVREGVYAASVDYEQFLELASKRDSRGSYRELRVALDSMPRCLRGEAALIWLSEHMPKTIRVPRWAFERELDGLRDEVESLKKTGLSVDEIKVTLGVSRRQVKALLRRRD